VVRVVHKVVHGEQVTDDGAVARVAVRDALHVLGQARGAVQWLATLGFVGQLAQVEGDFAGVF
jgi:hypothetical protein